MGKNGDRCVCEKIYRAVTVSPAFQAIQRISSRPGSRPASSAPNSSPPTPEKTFDVETKPDLAKPPKSAEAADVVPISFDYSIQAPSSEKKKPKPAIQPISIQTDEKIASKAKPEEARQTYQVPVQVNQTNPKVEAHQINKDEGKISGMHIEDIFTEYINHRKIKFRTMSHVGAQKKASGKDKFTDFLNRAGGKIRTTSGIDGGRSITLK